MLSWRLRPQGPPAPLLHSQNPSMCDKLPCARRSVTEETQLGNPDHKTPGSYDHLDDRHAHVRRVALHCASGRSDWTGDVEAASVPHPSAGLVGDIQLFLVGPD